jgi:hypothetical protein
LEQLSGSVTEYAAPSPPRWRNSSPAIDGAQNNYRPIYRGRITFESIGSLTPPGSTRNSDLDELTIPDSYYIIVDTSLAQANSRAYEVACAYQQIRRDLARRHARGADPRRRARPPSLLTASPEFTFSIDVSNY